MVPQPPSSLSCALIHTITRVANDRLWPLRLNTPWTEIGQERPLSYDRFYPKANRVVIAFG